MNVLVPTDAFPPVCGGSGWSTYELARGLRARGHDVTIVQPKPGTAAGARETAYDGFRVLQFGAPAPDIPYVRNYYKSEKLTRALTAYLTALLAARRYDIVHAQHVMTTVAAIEAAHAARVPVVATVRDYWPVCYWSDLLHTREGLTLCPACTPRNMTVCVQPRAGTLWPLALPMIPYMRSNLAAKREGLARADAVIAVSRRIAADLIERAPELSRTRIEVIPNAVDIAAHAGHGTADPFAHRPAAQRAHVVPRAALDHPPLRPAADLQHVVIGHELDQVAQRKVQDLCRRHRPQRRIQKVAGKERAAAIRHRLRRRHQPRGSRQWRGRCDGLRLRRARPPLPHGAAADVQGPRRDRHP